MTRPCPSNWNTRPNRTESSIGSARPTNQPRTSCALRDFESEPTFDRRNRIGPGNLTDPVRPANPVRIILDLALSAAMIAVLGWPVLATVIEAVRGTEGENRGGLI